MIIAMNLYWYWERQQTIDAKVIKNEVKIKIICKLYLSLLSMYMTISLLWTWWNNQEQKGGWITYSGKMSLECKEN